MKALYFVGERTMELKEVPLPQLDGSRYLLRVKANGICGSDFDGYMGKTGRRIPPMIMGHEVSCVIEDVPPGGKFRKGEKVVVFPKPFCGVCDLCKKGMVNVCPAGICMGVMDADGSMAEHIAVEEKYLIPFGGDLSFAEAAMTEPLAVAYRSVCKISDREIAESSNFMVIGAGTIGLMAVALLKMRGAKNVIVSDASNFRLGIAKKMLADHTVNPRETDLIQAVKSMTSGKMCDFSVEAVGLAVTASTSLEVLRIGGTAIWIGNAQKLVEVNMQKIVTTELTIKGNYVYDFPGFRESLRLLEEKKLDVSPLMTNVYPLSDGVQAFKDLEDNADGKMLKVFLES